MREAIRADEGGHQSQSVALEGRTRCSDDAAAVRVLSVRCRLPTTMRRARRGERRRRSSASDSWPPRTPPRTRRWEMTAARPGPWAGRALSAAATQQQGLGTEQDRSCPPRWLGLRKLAALTKPQRREGGTRRASRRRCPCLRGATSASDSWPPRTPPRTRRWEMTAARPGPWAGRALSAAATQQQGLGTEQDRSCPPRWLGLRKLAALTKPQRREGGTRRAFLPLSKKCT